MHVVLAPIVCTSPTPLDTMRCICGVTSAAPTGIRTTSRLIPAFLNCAGPSDSQNDVAAGTSITVAATFLILFALATAIGRSDNAAKGFPRANVEVVSPRTFGSKTPYTNVGMWAACNGV